MAKLFAYGTLMCPDIMRDVCGVDTTGLVARLAAFRRLRVRNEDYPGIVPSPAHSVTGMVYPDVHDTAWRLLDAFEGEMYSREQVQVRLATGNWLDAQAYVIRPAFRGFLEDRDWDFEQFLHDGGKARFRRSYRPWTPPG